MTSTLTPRPHWHVGYSVDSPSGSTPDVDNTDLYLDADDALNAFEALLEGAKSETSTRWDPDLAEAVLMAIDSATADTRRVPRDTLNVRIFLPGDDFAYQINTCANPACREEG